MKNGPESAPTQTPPTPDDLSPSLNLPMFPASSTDLEAGTPDERLALL